MQARIDIEKKRGAFSVDRGNNGDWSNDYYIEVRIC
jgi:hypothetical protein